MTIWAVALLLLAACQPPSLVTHHPSFTEARLTTDADDSYSYRATSIGVVGRALPTNRFTNLRVVGFPTDQNASQDAQVCATWTAGTDGMTQPGISLRVVATPGRVRAITVTNNILFGARWLFNVHLGDSASRNNMWHIGTVSFGKWTTAPLPWRICGRVVGTVVTVKAWALSLHPEEPAWDDPEFTGTLNVPRNWVYPGNAGWYIGHLAAGQELAYENITSELLSPQSVPDKPPDAILNGSLIPGADGEPG